MTINEVESLFRVKLTPELIGLRESVTAPVPPDLPKADDCVANPYVVAMFEPVVTVTAALTMTRNARVAVAPEVSVALSVRLYVPTARVLLVEITPVTESTVRPVVAASTIDHTNGAVPPVVVKAVEESARPKVVVIFDPPVMEIVALTRIVIEIVSKAPTESSARKMTV